MDLLRGLFRQRLLWPLPERYDSLDLTPLASPPVLVTNRRSRPNQRYPRVPLGLAQVALVPHVVVVGGGAGVVEDGGRNTPRDRPPPLLPSLPLHGLLQHSVLAPLLRRNSPPLLQHLAPAEDVSHRASRRRCMPIGPRR